MVCFSFIGFHAITMYSEEAETPNTVPKAIALALLIGGATFLLGARFAQSNTPVEIFTNIVLPVIGMTLTVVLWLNLHFDAPLYSAIWFVIGLVLLVYVTRGLRKPLTMRIEEETLAKEGTPIEDVEHRRKDGSK